MSKQNINVETASATLKFFLQFLNHVLNWMLLCQEGSPNQVLQWGEMVKSNQSPQSAALLKERLHLRFTYLEIKLSLKLVHYCVFFSCESNLISL